jgi:hypothetical protein
MRRGAEEQQLRCREPQQIAHRRPLGRQRPGDEAAQDIVDLAQPAKGGGDQQPGEGAVARRQIGRRASLGVQGVFERLVQGPAATEGFQQQLQGGPARGEPGRRSAAPPRRTGRYRVASCRNPIGPGS